MFGQVISLFPRKGGGGHAGGGKSGGGKSKSGKSGGSGGNGGGVNAVVVAAVITIAGLPKNHNKVKVYGKGGGKPIHIKSGVLQGWFIGGGKRGPEVYGNSFHPTVPPPKTLRWAFWPIPISLDIYASDAALHSFNQSLPQNLTRPGGELREMKMAPPENATTQYPPLFFVSDSLTVDKMKDAINAACGNSVHMVLSDPISFNSTGNIQKRNLVQFYRGDSAAMFLQGYNNADEKPGGPVPNPPLPSDATVYAWNCFNETIGKSIPLFENKASKGLAIGSGVGAAVLVIIVGFIVYWCHSKKKRPVYVQLENLPG